MTNKIEIPNDCHSQGGLKNQERRSFPSDRRKTEDRRAQGERRFDRRQAKGARSVPITGWLLSIIHPRLGVDRRKNPDRRRVSDRRLQSMQSILTKDEIADLLSP
jgi:hypothetical protein